MRLEKARRLGGALAPGLSYAGEPMNTNPYQPPGSSYDPHAPVGAGEDAAEVSDEIVEAMRQTRPWVLFLGVLGFISVGLMVLLGFGVMAMGGVKGMPSGALGIVYIILGAVYVIPSLYLWRFGSRIGTLVQFRSTTSLRDALVQQKSFWRFVGILSAVLIVVYVLVIVVAMAVGVMTAMGKR